MLILTALAQRVGPRLSGLLATCPIVMLIVAAFTHARDGCDAVVRYFRALLRGLHGFALFCFVFSVALGWLALGLSTAITLSAVCSARRSNVDTAWNGRVRSQWFTDASCTVAIRRLAAATSRPQLQCHTVVFAVLLTIGLAIAAAALPLQPSDVEHVYSTRIFPLIQQTLTPVSNATPVALLDLLLIVLIVVLPTRAVLTVRRAWHLRTFAPIGRSVAWLVVAAASVYVLFVALWGMNYRRVPMESRIALAPEAPVAEDVMRLGMSAARALNTLHGDAHQEGWAANEWRDDALRGAFREVQMALSDAPPATPGRLKQSVLGMYFRWSGVDGMVNPFGLEVLANPDLLPYERPFVAAHEWAHLAGFADESEASFVGWLTCMRASPAAQYSGWLYLYWQVAGSVDDPGRARLRETLTDPVRRDVDAIVERIRAGQLPLLRNASWLVYDQYLKANRVDEGVRSYDAALTLIARARYDEASLPMRVQ